MATLPLSATHIMGGELTYQHLGGSDYKVDLVLYRDCAGILVDPTESIWIGSLNCSILFPATLFLTDTVTLSSGCANLPTTCEGGTAPGMQIYFYTDTITLPATCTDWRIWWAQCCRNGAIQNLVDPTTLDSYLEARLDNVNHPDNSSPVFQEMQLPFVCYGEPFCLDNAAYEPDGDSLAYSMSFVYNGDPSTPAWYVPPYSPFDPLPTANGVSFDPTTGNMCCTPTGVGAFVVGFQVDEYRNGMLIGGTRRDLQLWVVPCPSANLGISGTVFDSTGTAVSSGSVELWEYGLNSQNSTMLNSTPVNAQGEYAFSGLPGGQYLVRAIVDTSQYPGLADSYHAGTYYWQYADVLHSVCDTVLQADIALVGYGDLNGSGYLGGYLGDLGIMRSTVGDPWPDVDVILERWPEQVLVACARTNASGHYAFNNVPFGEYRILMDHPGLPMLGYYHVTVDALHTTFADLDYAADPFGFFTTSGTTSVQETTGTQIMIAPNPVGAEGLLHLRGLNDGPMLVQVDDVMGRRVLVRKLQVTGGQALVTLGPLPPGAYLIRIGDGKVLRLVKE
ncbi:MAG: hypothetical protein H6597_04670 [Flavobacteriales bacterium]|nr:hypothetical protein [Flavobacteriales bacterium]MCB9193807.1 hypothetical protein [Flavobacteriales bacterium]